MKTKAVILNCLLALLLTSIVIQHTYSQEPLWKYAFTASDGDIATMLTDSIGNCYLTGTFQTDYFRYATDSVPGFNASETVNTFLLKTSPTGKLIWLHSIYGTTEGALILPQKMEINERGETVLIFKATNTYDLFLGDLILPVNFEKDNCLVTKISKNGSITWVHQLISSDYYGATPGEINATDLFVEEGGDVYLTGFFRGSTASLTDFVIDGMKEFAMLFVGRINPDGQVAWFNNCPVDTSLGKSNINTTLIANSPGNTFYIGGYHDGNQMFSFGNDTLRNAIGTDAFIACYTKDGISQWARSFRGDSTDFAEGIEVMQNGDVILMGYCNSSILDIDGSFYSNPSGNYDIYLARYAPNGMKINSANIAVRKNYFNDTGLNARLRHDLEDNIILCSEFQAVSIFDNPFTLPNPQPGTNDIFIAKLNGISFTPLWTFQGTAPGDNNFEGVHIDRFGNISFAGSSYNDLILPTSTIIGNSTEGTPYTVKVNTDGSLDYAFWQLNTTDNQLRMKTIASDLYGNAFVAGIFYGPANALGSTDMPTLGPQGLYLAKYSRVSNVSGFVQNSLGEPVTQAYVKIYGYTFYQNSPLNDSVSVGPDGSYFFHNIPYGKYLIVAQPITNDQNIYVSTYYPSAIYWESGEQITVNSMAIVTDLDIIMQESILPEGITLMEGNVSFDDNIKKTISATYDKGRPSKKANVILAGNKKQKSTYEIISTTETDDNGNFSFLNVEDGSYYIWVDYPGLPVIDAYFITISDHQYVSSLDYIVNEETVNPAGLPHYSAINYTTGEQSFTVYPNPASDYIDLIVKDHVQCKVDIIDSKGVNVMQIQLSSSCSRIDLTELTPGNYLVRLVADNSISFNKITIIR